MSAPAIFLALLMGINELEQLYAALNITSLIYIFYCYLQLPVKLIRKIFGYSSYISSLALRHWSEIQSSHPALYPATDSEYQIQWGTYGDLVKTPVILV